MSDVCVWSFIIQGCLLTDVTCSCSALLVTAERRADSAASGRGAREEGREGEGDRCDEEPSIKANRGAPELSWSASDDDSLSDENVYRINY